MKKQSIEVKEAYEREAYQKGKEEGRKEAIEQVEKMIEEFKLQIVNGGAVIYVRELKQKLKESSQTK